MARPEFTPDEQYVLSHLRSSNAEASNGYAWGYIIGSAIVAGVAAYESNIPLLCIAFSILCGCRIWEDRYQRKWTPVWRSIVDKYEAAIADADKQHDM